MKKFFVVFLTVLFVGAFAFADAAETYLNHFEALVTSIEAAATNKDYSNLSSYEAQKIAIDAERATVELGLLQRFTDWRYTGRYDSAHSKLESYLAKDNASSKATEVKSSVSEKAGEAAATIKESAGEKAETVKAAANEKAAEAESNAKTTINAKAQELSDKANAKAAELEAAAKEKAQEAKAAADEKAQAGAAKATNFLNSLLNGDEE